MKDAHAYASWPIAELYEWFAGEAEPTSPAWARLCRWMAGRPQLCARLDELPGTKRQPNLFLGAVRYFAGPTEPGEGFEDWVMVHWPEISELIGRRATQTNEPGRCAVLAPALALLPQPICLLEVGASAGLCLVPDRYNYRYTGDVEIAAEGRSAESAAPVLECQVQGALPGDPAELAIAARFGLDANPLVADDLDDARWLRALVWPCEDAREARLSAALRVAGRQPPRIIRGVVPADLERLLGLAPPGITPVLMHSATLAYLPRAERDDFEARVRASGVHWLSLEGSTVVSSLRDKVPPEPRPHFVLALDGVPLATCSPHGAWARWHQPIWEDGLGSIRPNAMARY